MNEKASKFCLHMQANAALLLHSPVAQAKGGGKAEGCKGRVSAGYGWLGQANREEVYLSLSRKV